MGDDEEVAREYTQIFGSSSNNTYSRLLTIFGYLGNGIRYQDDTLGCYFFSRRGGQGLLEYGQCLRVKKSTQLCKLIKPWCSSWCSNPSPIILNV